MCLKHTPRCTAFVLWKTHTPVWIQLHDTFFKFSHLMSCVWNLSNVLCSYIKILIHQRDWEHSTDSFSSCFSPKMCNFHAIFYSKCNVLMEWVSSFMLVMFFVLPKWCFSNLSSLFSCWRMSCECLSSFEGFLFAREKTIEKFDMKLHLCQSLSKSFNWAARKAKNKKKMRKSKKKTW